MGDLGYRKERIVRYVTLYDPAFPKCELRGRGSKVYKLIISNEEDGRSLYTEILSMEYFRTRELKKVHPNKHHKMRYASLDREDEWEMREQTWERIGVPRATIEKTVYGIWALYRTIGYDRKKKRYVAQETS